MSELESRVKLAENNWIQGLDNVNYMFVIIVMTIISCSSIEGLGVLSSLLLTVVVVVLLLLIILSLILSSLILI